MKAYCEDKTIDMFKPSIGMKFSSEKEAYDFYNTYSWVVGFSIRNGDNWVNIKGVKKMQEFKCQRSVSTLNFFISQVCIIHNS